MRKGLTMEEKVNALIEEIKQEENKETIAIKLIPNTKVSLTSSNVAGVFYLPKTDSIPVNENGDQLMYLAQINCEELPANNIYPKTGIMQFWIFGGDVNTDSGLGECTSDINKRVIYYPTIKEHYNVEELADIYKPNEAVRGELISSICKNAPFAMVFEKINQWITPDDFRFEKLFNEKWEKFFPNNISISPLLDIDYEPAGYILDELYTENHIQIGGYGFFSQFDIDPRGCFDDDGNNIYENYTELLFQIYFKFRDEFVISDNFDVFKYSYGVGNFFATRDQLKNLDFEECLYTWYRG